jgi:hypothetical protein
MSVVIIEATAPDLDRTIHTTIHGGLDFNMKLPGMVL